MSTNLHLDAKDERGTVYCCALLQTPSTVTDWCLGAKTKKRSAIVRDYFEWAAKEAFIGRPGALLDHKLEVLSFIVEHPEARFYGA